MNSSSLTLNTLSKDHDETRLTTQSSGRCLLGLAGGLPLPAETDRSGVYSGSVDTL